MTSKKIKYSKIDIFKMICGFILMFIIFITLGMVFGMLFLAGILAIISCRYLFKKGKKVPAIIALVFGILIFLIFIFIFVGAYLVQIGVLPE